MIEAAGRACELDGALQQPTIQICPNQTVAKIDECSLRERWRIRTEAVEHHLHPKVDDRQLDHLGVGNLR